MAVSNILDEIENLVVDGKHIVFTNKSIIEEPDLVRLIDDLRNELPLELQQAEQVMQDKEAILTEAREEAERIVNQAKEYANHLVDESEVVKQSQEKAALIMEQTKAQEQEILNTAYSTAQQLRTDSSQYANQVFDHLIVNVGNALQVLQQAKDELQRMPVQQPMPQERDYGQQEQ
ncbi:ATP synthase subunit B family protein [Schwartzia succinivorans]|jgi:F0F1-type ATP synthase membrane subunit b/b'|uniref:ATPase n=1 Tax=Schwartzia succinivorans DSM 10502 TaxID=1123243 RepID=A0A1M4T1N3_9FIRM|nr:ATPase [Schwartzia succinivorans]MBQ1470223.1 ATPase [Schwartzia sp. (in: firmicutes)]MBQ1917985.1 ATPase [Schwartzia sp. (in: firmicutes)]MBQ2047475.1 ATPase [Schwartzia sp. (in: firmicutes)]MBQ3863431.1 ATPase [Schwartzia sp. (in: firmicutes)]MBQ4152520.1 ATPase [Schwartzia sp. (in: firmicutes)]